MLLTTQESVSEMIKSKSILGTIWRKFDRLGRIVAIDKIDSYSRGWVYATRYTNFAEMQTRYPIEFLSDVDFGSELVSNGASVQQEMLLLKDPVTIVTSGDADWPRKILDYYKDGHRHFATNSESIQSLMLSAAQRMKIEIFVDLVKI